MRKLKLPSTFLSIPVILIALAGRAHVMVVPDMIDSSSNRQEQTTTTLSALEWHRIRDAHEEWKRSFRREGGGWQASHPFGLTTRYDEQGFAVSTSSGNWQWGLELIDYGFGEAALQISAAPLQVRAAATRISIERDENLTEWMVSEPAAFEHGFTLRRRPGRASGKEKLTLRLRLRGDLEPLGSIDGQNLTFGDALTGPLVNYSKLRVWDARGEEQQAWFNRESDRTISIVVDESRAVYPLTIDPTVSLSSYLKPAFIASDGVGDDAFGRAVAIHENTVVISAPGEDGAAAGVNGNDQMSGLFSSGAVYVFVRSGLTWTQQAYLKASNPGPGDEFGSAVAISGDTIVVGARGEYGNDTGVNGNQNNDFSLQSGAAYVFVRSGSTWTQQAYLKPSNTGQGDQFGSAVAISGETIVVGAQYESSSATGINGDPFNNNASNSGAAYVFVRNGSTWLQQAYLKASNTNSSDYFGFSVGIAGETIVVGAYGESSMATGINGNQADNSLAFSGATYVFVRSGSTWTQQAYLKASNPNSSDLFGYSVAISGESLVVGAQGEGGGIAGVNGNQADNSQPFSGAAYVFNRNGTEWVQQAYLKAGNPNTGDFFGSVVGIAGDSVLVAARNEDGAVPGVDGNQADNNSTNSGAAYIFTRSGTTWTPSAYLKASNPGNDDGFGTSAAISGDLVIIGAPFEDSLARGVNGNQSDNSINGAGSAYAFTRINGVWGQQAYLKASNTESSTYGSDRFGEAVAISGDSIVIGAPLEDGGASGVNGDPASKGLVDSGSAYVFVRSGTTWTQQAYLKASNPGLSDNFGTEVAIFGDTIVVSAPGEDSGTVGVNGNQTDNSQTDAGAVYVFVRSGAVWTQQAYLKPNQNYPLGQFGRALGISGDTIVSGSADGVFVHTRNGTTWTQQAIFQTDAADLFGQAVGIDANTIVVGAPGEDSSAAGINGNQSDNSLTDAGAAYVFGRSGTTWTLQAFLKASNPGAFDRFGGAVSIFGDRIAVGAAEEDSSAKGVNGLQSDNSLINAGAAYVFQRVGTIWTQEAYLKASNSDAGDLFGTAVAVGCEFIVVTAINEAGDQSGVTANQALNGSPQAGAGYLFSLTGTTWSQLAYLKARNTLRGDQLGTAAAISPDYVLLGAAGDDSSLPWGVYNTSLPGKRANEVGAAQIYQINNSIPVIQSLTPLSAVQGSSGLTLTVNGSNFVTGAAVWWNGKALTTTFISSIQLTAEIPASDLTASGNATVLVINPGPCGRPSLTSTFTITAPNPAAQLVSLLPSIVAKGSSALTLTVNGSGFINGAVVRINGSDRPTTFISTTQLSAVIQASDSAAIGQLSVTVLNPSAPVSNNISLQVINRVTTVSAASYSIGGQAPNSILAAFGSGLATGIEVATTSPLPASLLGTKVVVRDSGGISRDQALFFVAPGQVNFHLHQDTALGSATVSVLVNDAVVSLGDLVITKLSPAIFTQNASGSGVPAAYALRYRGSEVTAVQIMSFDQALGSWIPIPIDLGPEEDKLYLVLFGTGFRANSGIANASVRIGTETLNPVYAGAAPIYVGLDQLNVGPIPRSLVGAGLVNLEVTLDGLSANQSKTLQIRIK